MSATRTIAWVGKGIVYDTGGLCIKAKVSVGLQWWFHTPSKFYIPVVSEGI